MFYLKARNIQSLAIATILPEVTLSREMAVVELPFSRPIRRARDRESPPANVKAITLGGGWHISYSCIVGIRIGHVKCPGKREKKRKMGRNGDGKVQNWCFALVSVSCRAVRKMRLDDETEVGKKEKREQEKEREKWS